MQFEESYESFDLEELYQTNCEEIDLIFGRPIKRDSPPVPQKEPSRKQPILQNAPILTRKTRKDVDLLIAYYLCQLKAVRYGISLPNELEEPEEIKEAIHTYQLERSKRSVRKLPR